MRVGQNVESRHPLSFILLDALLTEGPHKLAQQVPVVGRMMENACQFDDKNGGAWALLQPLVEMISLRCKREEIPLFYSICLAASADNFTLVTSGDFLFHNDPTLSVAHTLAKKGVPNAFRIVPVASATVH